MQEKTSLRKFPRLSCTEFAKTDAFSDNSRDGQQSWRHERRGDRGARADRQADRLLAELEENSKCDEASGPPAKHWSSRGQGKDHRDLATL